MRLDRRNWFDLFRRTAAPTAKHPWAVAGVLLCGGFVGLLVISPQFSPPDSDLNKPIIGLVALMMATGAIYLYVVFGFRPTQFGRGLLLWVLVVGFVMRICMFVSTPMLEDDFYRYFWDGGVLTNGFNPFKYTPSGIQNENTTDIPDQLRRLADDSGEIIHRINHPWLRTIYPPVAQVAFAVAQRLKPWSLTAWRVVLLVMDLATCYLVFLSLRRMNRGLKGLVIYWWNPLLVKEIFNSAHMDVLLLPFLLIAFLSFNRKNYLGASGAIGIAFGLKFWPAILVPVILRPIIGNMRRLIPALLVFVVLAILMLLPFYKSGLDHTSGLTAYRSYWEMNDALFMLMLWGIKSALTALGQVPWDAQTVTRATVTGILIAWTLWVVRRPDLDPRETSRRFLLVIAALFLLSPTQFPWYYLWMLPFLAIHPQKSLLLLTFLLPIYYLRFFLKARNLVAIHDNGLVWIEFLPVWALLIREWYQAKQSKAPTSLES